MIKLMYSIHQASILLYCNAHIYIQFAVMCLNIHTYIYVHMCTLTHTHTRARAHHYIHVFIQLLGLEIRHTLSNSVNILIKCMMPEVHLRQGYNIILLICIEFVISLQLHKFYYLCYIYMYIIVE
jgi:hypothetical protein